MRRRERERICDQLVLETLKGMVSSRGFRRELSEAGTRALLQDMKAAWFAVISCPLGLENVHSKGSTGVTELVGIDSRGLGL